MPELADSSGDEYDAECPYCSGNFSQDTRGEKWAKCDSCFKWAHEDCGDVASNPYKINVSNIRNKRGLIKGISYALKWLFGTPDADDAQFYSDSINSIINDQKQNEVLMQQQASIISQTITNFNNSLARLDENIMTLNKI
ncbi:hypothetical protein HHI36_022764 [Cryptolaemus montrouzieri]|uniref:Phorbol-ester/DAG-type domain-containing protein n=1 Tax=Cryptolaemus montrouzieri TaxID=559131 RepID=A0ABD2N1W8_9CUCU